MGKRVSHLDKANKKSKQQNNQQRNTRHSDSLKKASTDHQVEALPLNHPFFHEKIVFATQHQKDQIIASLFQDRGLSVLACPVNTDQFGTFSGEVNRTGTIRETLRKKIQEAEKLDLSSRLFLASEGSFGPHPLLGFGQSDLESLLLWDRKEKIEIYAEHLSLEVVHSEIVLSLQDSPDQFLKSVQFPDHALIVRPENSFSPLYKAVQDLQMLQQALQHCCQNSPTERAILATDLRAHLNPTRRKAIFQAGLRLIDKILSQCPQCHYPGFDVTQTIPGLPCSECEEPSQAAQSLVFSCPLCRHQETRGRPDGLTHISPAECANCNP